MAIDTSSGLWKNGGLTKEQKLRSQKRNQDPRRREAATMRSRKVQQGVAGYMAEAQRRHRALYGRTDGWYAKQIEESANPLSVSSEGVAVVCDFHVPFYSLFAMDCLLETCAKHNIRDIICVGDLFDCDDYSKFVNLTMRECFIGEVEEVQTLMKILTTNFDRLYFCRGNHEKRWMIFNMGKVGMKELFALVRPPGLSGENFNSKVFVTSDDHITLTHNKEKWLLCHPRNFRQVPLSVARCIASVELCNIGSAHGHQWAQGRDVSGKFKCLDLGGMFKESALSYKRDVNCYPSIKGGFYIFKNGEILPFSDDLWRKK